jgi:hypothetical protein
VSLDQGEIVTKLGVIFYVLAAAALLAAAAGAVFGPEWIEELTRLQPDRGSGSLEGLLVVGPAVAAVLLGASGYTVRRVAHS